MTTLELVNAYAAHVSAVEAYEIANPFDLMTAMDRPAAPVQSTAAQAGEMIVNHYRGLNGALAIALTHTLDGSTISDEKRAVYTELTIAAAE